MKLTLKLIACSLAVLSYSNSFGDIHVSKQNGGTNGWDKITESHTNGSDDLICIDPGSNACVWTVQPKCDILKTDKGQVSITNVIEPDVEVQLNKGVKSGSMSFSPYIVTWNGTDANNYELTVSLND